jgi:hypothetical protein
VPSFIDKSLVDNLTELDLLLNWSDGQSRLE